MVEKEIDGKYYNVTSRDIRRELNPIKFYLREEIVGNPVRLTLGVLALSMLSLYFGLTYCGSSELGIIKGSVEIPSEYVASQCVDISDLVRE